MNNSRRSCFTIIELLVVIAIIGILASILLPTLNNARKFASEISCTGNLRQIGFAHAEYACENNNWICGEGPYTGGTARTSSILSGSPLVRKGMARLLPYMGEQVLTLYCPRASGQTTELLRYTGNNKTNWENNSGGVYSSYCTRIWSLPPYDGRMKLDKLGRVVHTADAICMYDSSNPAVLISHFDGRFGKWNTQWTDGSVTVAKGNQTAPTYGMVFNCISTGGVANTGKLEAAFIGLGNQ